MRPTHSFTRCTHSLTQAFTLSTHALTHALTYYPVTVHVYTHSLTHSLTRSVTHSVTHLCRCVSVYSYSFYVSIRDLTCSDLQEQFSKHLRGSGDLRGASRGSREALWGASRGSLGGPRDLPEASCRPSVLFGASGGSPRRRGVLPMALPKPFLRPFWRSKNDGKTAPKMHRRKVEEKSSLRH